MDLSYIAPPVDIDLLKKELTKKRFIRSTGKLNNEIYIVNIHNAPNTVREVGRLRELTFASANGGTGKEVDLDHFDLNEFCYQQLIVWNPEDEEIVGGYRFIDGAVISSKGDWKNDLSMSHYFNFNDKFISEYLPKSIELGRSWVQPKYQPANDPRKGMFALDNIWDGLGAICLKYAHVEYFYGKVTMYPSYNITARDHVLNFLKYYFPDHENLMSPSAAAEVPKLKMTADLFPIDYSDFAKSFKTGQRNLNRICSQYGESIPPLIKQYMGLSPSMMTFGTFINNDFGNVEETGILIPIDSIYEDKKERYIRL
ncbi:MAG: hemolysin [Flavobacteriales bacterium]|nr:hemolysin [Flavobacteriales bacterium]